MATVLNKRERSAGFISGLHLELKEGRDDVWIVEKVLAYYSKLLDDFIYVPPKFETDLASVPRIPIVYRLWGNRAHREAVLHDFLFRCDALPQVSFETANLIFQEAMLSRDVKWYVRKPMYWGVCVGGWPSWHQRNVEDVI